MRTGFRNCLNDTLTLGPFEALNLIGERFMPLRRHRYFFHRFLLMFLENALGTMFLEFSPADKHDF